MKSDAEIPSNAGTTAIGKTLSSAPMRSAKAFARRVMGEWLGGVIDYYRHPRLRQSWGGPLNGQKHRQKMIEAFVRELGLDAIIETGTFRGTTTSFFARLTSRPIYTVEFDRKYWGFNWAALRRFKHVHRFGGDSRSFLRLLAGDEPLRAKTILFYLDAHWNADLPLSQEIEIIFSHWTRAVVLVDDFQVIDDPGYGYDDYGSCNALDLQYIEPARRKFGLSIFYPSLPSSQETGLRRGSVILVAESGLAGLLRKMSEIREYSG